MIPEEGKVKVTYWNNYSITPGTLRLVKYSEGPWWKQPDTFSFIVEFEQAGVEMQSQTFAEYALAASGAADASVGSRFEFEIYGGNSVTFTNILPGTTFTITELIDPDYEPDSVSYTCYPNDVLTTVEDVGMSGTMPGTAYEAASVDVACANTYDWPDIVVTKLVNGQKSVHVAPGSTVEYTVNIEYFAPEYAGYIALKDSKISDLSAILEVTSRDPRYVISSVDWSDDEEGTIIIDLDLPNRPAALSEDGDEPNPGEETNVITVKFSSHSKTLIFRRSITRPMCTSTTPNGKWISTVTTRQP